MSFLEIWDPGDKSLNPRPNLECKCLFLGPESTDICYYTGIRLGRGEPYIPHRAISTKNKNDQAQKSPGEII